MKNRLPKFVFAVLAIVSAVPAKAAERPPNIIVIMADDLGYGDVGVYGAEGYETPNIDRLAEEGMRFTQFYVPEAVCSASRASLMTGRLPNRVGISGALMPDAAGGLDPDETTIAEVARDSGYATGMAGKWHLGHRPEYLPLRQGFEVFFGIPYSNDMWPQNPNATRPFPPLPLIENDDVVNESLQAADQEQLTTRFTEHAVEFIERNYDRPFFYYLAHPMPHVPLFVSDKFQGKSEKGLYGDVIMEIDWSVGQILEALERHGIDDHTLVVFLSDNGPWLLYGDHAGSSGPLREGKRTVWEGGVRVPFLARWPGRIPAGVVQTEPAMSVDLLPMIARLIGGRLPDRRLDGFDIWPLMEGRADARSPRSAFFFSVTGPIKAVYDTRWKLVLPHRYSTVAASAAGSGGWRGEWSNVEVTKPELYDLENDPSETRDVAERFPKIVERLLKLAMDARAEFEKH